MVELQNLNFRYKSSQKLFEDLNLTLAPGHIYGLLGKNGMGKSTLLKHICGMLFPSSGICKVLGFNATDRSPLMLQNIFLVPEEFELPPVSIRTYVKLHAVFYPGFDHSQFDAYIKEFELSNDVKINEFSHGQKKKFLLAFGLATNVSITIMDEPTNGLDIPSKSQFRKIIASAMNDEKMIIISTHQVRDLENLIDVVVVVENGSIVFKQTTTEISEKLFFEENIRSADPQDLIYEEDNHSRKKGIVLNHDQFESKIDLELLFNCVVKNNDKINKCFK